MANYVSAKERRLTAMSGLKTESRRQGQSTFSDDRMLVLKREGSFLWNDRPSTERFISTMTVVEQQRDGEDVCLGMGHVSHSVQAAERREETVM